MAQIYVGSQTYCHFLQLPLLLHSNNCEDQNYGTCIRDSPCSNGKREK